MASIFGIALTIGGTQRSPLFAGILLVNFLWFLVYSLSAMEFSHLADYASILTPICIAGTVANVALVLLVLIVRRRQNQDGTGPIFSGRLALLSGFLALVAGGLILSALALNVTVASA